MQPDACSIALFDAEKVLLIVRAQAPYTGRWTLPGGRMEPGETTRDCVVRELFEETGFVVDDPREVLIHPVGTGERQRRLTVFAARHPVATPVASEEIADWLWVELGAVGTYNTTPRLEEILHLCAARLGPGA